MIRSAAISNFRCYQSLIINEFSRLNVVVGDNGVGKTALLEALFLTLSASTEVTLRLKQHRGLAMLYNGSVPRIEEAVWGDYFYRNNMNIPIAIELKGEGIATRALKIQRGRPGETFFDAGAGGSTQESSLSFTWTRADGLSHTVQPSAGANGLILPSTPEDLPDWFFFGHSMPVSAAENAGRFSDLSRAKRKNEFVDVFCSEYPWISDLNIEVLSGAPSLFATMSETGDSFPVGSVSGGINRTISYLLAIASRSNSIVIVDEIENGVYYKHHEGMWRSILKFMRAYDSQVIVSTHSEESLAALLRAADKDLSDVSLWRLTRSEGQPTLQQFSGEDLKAGLEYGIEIR